MQTNLNRSWLTAAAVAVVGAGLWTGPASAEDGSRTKTVDRVGDAARAADAADAAHDATMAADRETRSSDASRSANRQDRSSDQGSGGDLNNDRGKAGQNADPQDAAAIRDTLANVVGSAVHARGLDDMVKRFAPDDRKRIGSIDTRKYEQYTQLATDFQNAWKAKYGQSFEIKDDAQVFNARNFQINQAATPDAAAQMASDRTGGSDNPQARESRLDRGDYATVTIPASHGMSEARLNLRTEARKWRLDVADSLDQQKLHDSLLTHLRQVQDSKDRWPADSNEAYQLVARHVFAALSESGGGSSAGSAGMTSDGIRANSGSTVGNGRAADGGATSGGVRAEVEIGDRVTERAVTERSSERGDRATRGGAAGTGSSGERIIDRKVERRETITYQREDGTTRTETKTTREGDR